MAITDPPTIAKLKAEWGVSNSNLRAYLKGAGIVTNSDYAPSVASSGDLSLRSFLGAYKQTGTYYTRYFYLGSDGVSVLSSNTDTVTAGSMTTTAWLGDYYADNQTGIGGTMNYNGYLRDITPHFGNTYIGEVSIYLCYAYANIWRGGSVIAQPQFLGGSYPWESYGWSGNIAVQAGDSIQFNVEVWSDDYNDDYMRLGPYFNIACNIFVPF